MEARKKQQGNPPCPLSRLRTNNWKKHSYLHIECYFACCSTLVCFRHYHRHPDDAGHHFVPDGMVVDSPRRSPRISARSSLEASHRNEAPSPLTDRSHARQEYAANAPPPFNGMTSTPTPMMRKSRSSTSVMTSSSSSSLNAAAHTSSPSRKGKIARRAYSVGGAALHRQRQADKDNTVSVPSRRNVPGPRKSAIRALPPQVFLSPSELSPPSGIRPFFSRKSIGLEAFGGPDLMSLMESIGILKGQRDATEASTDEKIAKAPRKSAPVASTSERGKVEELAGEDEQTAARKRRRVTFNPRQESANFEKDEPTMRIRPAGEALPSTNTSNPSSSSSSSSPTSNSSSDMSIDSDDSASLPSDDDDSQSESEAEVEGQISAVFEEDGASSNDHVTGEGSVNREDESAMDMTAAYGSVQDATATGMESAFGADGDDDDSLTEPDTDSQADASSVLDDATLTMQLTGVHGEGNISTTFRRADESEEEDVEEEDDVEKQLEDVPVETTEVSEDKSVTDMDISDVKEDEEEFRSVKVERDEREIEALPEANETSAMDIDMDLDTTHASVPSIDAIDRSPTTPTHAEMKPIKLPLQTRKAAPNARVSRSPSPNTKPTMSTALRSPIRRQSAILVPDRHQSVSPKRGHEFCGKPAAESPKPRVSATTLRVQARREASQSPRKSTIASFRASIGQRPASPEKMPFRTSMPRSPTQQRPTQTDNARRSPSPELHDQASTPRKSDPSNRRPSSPLRTPGSPSRTWQKFRQDHGSPQERSPARRLSLSAPSDSVLPTFGTPQRIALPSAKRRESIRPLNASSLTPGRAAHKTARPAGPEMNADTDEGRITMKQFFDSLDMGFLDLTLPAKRRIELRDRKDRPADTPALMRAAYATVPALDGLIEACREIKASVDEGRSVLTDMEREFYDNPPSYVAEVMAMETPSDRQKAISSFKIQKSAARAIALKAYYGWRTDKQFDDAVLGQLERTQAVVEADVERVREAKATLRAAILPRLRERSVRVTEELTKAKKRQSEIAGWDEEEMRGMHEAMVEQNSVLDEQRAKCLETKEQLGRLTMRIDELQERRTNAEQAIAVALASSNAIRSSTRDEAARLARHVEQLEQLHLWSIERATGKEILLRFRDGDRHVALTMQLVSGAVESAQLARISPVSFLAADEAFFVRLLEGLQDKVAQLVESSECAPMDVVRTVSVLFMRLRRMHITFAALAARYPTERLVIDGGETLLLRLTVLLRSLRTKLVVDVRCSVEALFATRRQLFLPEDVRLSRSYGHPTAVNALSARMSDALLGSDTTRGAFDVPRALDEALAAIC